VAFVGLTAAITGVTAAFRGDEQAQIRTVQTLKATGNAAGVTAQEMFTLSEALQDVTTFSDSAILEGENLLLTFRNIGGETIPRATEAMLDMSTAMGTGIKESAIQLGKALNDPVAGISALTRVGITFSDEQKRTIKSLDALGDRAGAQAIILKELEMQFGGVSRAATQGTGKFIQLANIFGNLASKIGETTTVILGPFIDKLIEIGKKLRDGDSAFASITGKVLVYGSAIAAATGVTAGIILVLVKLRNALLIARTAAIAFGSAAASAWAKATLGLSLIVTGIVLLVEEMGGLNAAIDRVNAGFQLVVSKIVIGFNNARIATNELLASMKELGIATLEALPGNAFAEKIQSMRQEVRGLVDANDDLIAKNQDLGKSFNEIFEGISAERAAEAVREQEAAAREARAEAATLEAERKLSEENKKREAESEQRDIVAEEKAAAFEAEIEIIDIENKIRQAQTDKASNVEITKLKQKLADIQKTQDKAATVEQKAKFKKDKEIREAEEKDAKERLEFKKKFGKDTINAAVFLIEKAGALASIAMNTAKAVTLALASAPPPLNFALAAATGAAGAIQAAAVVGTALGLEQGGMVGSLGASRPGDRHPAMLADGELVVPRRNFEEVVSATAKQRGFTNSNESTGNGASRIEISFTDEAAEFITAKQFENSTLGTDRG
jgi:hypothetical protein